MTTPVIAYSAVPPGARCDPLGDRLGLTHVRVPLWGHEFHAIVDPEGVVLAGGFGDAAALWDRLWVARREPAPELTTPALTTPVLTAGRAREGSEAAPAPVARVAALLGRYAQGDLDALAGIRVQQPGTAFQQSVWQALREVPPGSPATYSELALAAHRPRAVRAVATACASNLVALIVPCHRIIRKDGDAGGYLFGTQLKQVLLAAEDPSQHATHPTNPPVE